MNTSDFLCFIEAKKLFFYNEPILLAVSGGIDSSVMVDLFHRSKLVFALAHCNFGLRGRESDADSTFVKYLANKLHVPFYTKKFDTTNYALEHGISIQMAAREIRYEWFEKVRSGFGFEHIATAHHLDDQAETFLINLIRGTGIAGLHGIPVKKGHIVRPLLFTSRKEIEQYATKYQVPYREDHSNNETKYLRNKIRHELLPIIGAINPEFTRGLSNTIRKIYDFEQIGIRVLEEGRKRLTMNEGGDSVIMIANLLLESPIESFAWEALSPFGFNESQVQNILACLLKEGKRVFLSPSYRLVKDRGKLVINKIQTKSLERAVMINYFTRKKSVTTPFPLVFTREKKVNKYVIPATGTIASLDFDKLQFPLSVRKWQHGDAFFPLGMKKKKKLSDFFTDQKIPIKEKEQTRVLCSGKDIVWIIGHRIDHRYRVTSATREILSIVRAES